MIDRLLFIIAAVTIENAATYDNLPRAEAAIVTYVDLAIEDLRKGRR